MKSKKSRSQHLFLATTNNKSTYWNLVQTILFKGQTSLITTSFSNQIKHNILKNKTLNRKQQQENLTFVLVHLHFIFETISFVS